MNTDKITKIFISKIFANWITFYYVTNSDDKLLWSSFSSVCVFFFLHSSCSLCLLNLTDSERIKLFVSPHIRLIEKRTDDEEQEQRRKKKKTKLLRKFCVRFLIIRFLCIELKSNHSVNWISWRVVWVFFFLSSFDLFNILCAYIVFELRSKLK